MKSTLVLVIIAIALGGFVYWHEYKRAPKEATQTNPAVFNFQPSDVASITYARPGQDIVVDRNGSQWQIVQPVKTRADQTAVNGLLDEVTLDRSSNTITPSGNQLKSFGLAPPSVTVELKLKNGQTHQLKVGATDFSGENVYAQADNSPKVLLLPKSMGNQATKSLSDLRDDSVLGITDSDVKSFDLKLPGKEIAAARSSGTDSNWSIDKPRALGGDSTAIGQLLSNVASAKMASVVADDTNNLARYGLAHPDISLTVNLNSGGDRTLDLGQKKGDQYYARDSSRSMVFLVPASFQKQLDVKLFDLRDKKLLHSLPDDFTALDYGAGSLKFSCAADKDGQWTITQPASDKGKGVADWKLFDALASNNAQEIIDSPPASLLAKMAHPAVQIDLTLKSGGKKTFRISQPAGNSVYVSISGDKSLYRVPKQMLDSLTFKSVNDVLR